MEDRILFVDDEKSILKAIERLFFDTDYELFVAESGEEGLDILKENPIDIVVSDMRMPGMDGHQFLKKVKALYPATTRLVLSGYADEKEILDSLIDGSNSLYLFKPWNGEDLKKKIEQIFTARKIYRNPILLNLVNGLENLAVVTGIYDAVGELIAKDAEASAIAKVIETDPAVTAAILRVVNSAFYNVKTASVLQAINYLGLSIVKSIVLSCSLFKLVDLSIPPFSVEELTRHANLTNRFMSKIYRELLQKKMPDNLSTAGLLHNLGLVLCIHYFANDYQEVLKDALQTDTLVLTELEKERLGVTHEEMGGYLLDWWGIPYPIVECALFHHQPLHSAVIDREAVSAVHLANYYAWKLIAPSMKTPLEEGVFDFLQIAQSDCEAVLLRD